MSYLRRRECPIRAAKQRARRVEMVNHYRSGKTTEEIAAIYGTSRQNISQLLASEGVTGRDGRAVRRDKKRSAARAALDAHCLDRFGCTSAQLESLRQLGRPLKAYKYHKAHAQQRGIEWGFNLWQWWTVWQESGHWHERGRGRGEYVMCRHGDEGPYSVDNVYIATSSQNIRDGYLNRGYSLNSRRTRSRRNAA